MIQENQIILREGTPVRKCVFCPLWVVKELQRSDDVQLTTKVISKKVHQTNKSTHNGLITKWVRIVDL